MKSGNKPHSTSPVWLYVYKDICQADAIIVTHSLRKCVILHYHLHLWRGATDDKWDACSNKVHYILSTYPFLMNV